MTSKKRRDKERNIKPKLGKKKGKRYKIVNFQTGWTRILFDIKLELKSRTPYHNEIRLPCRVNRKHKSKGNNLKKERIKFEKTKRGYLQNVIKIVV